MKTKTILELLTLSSSLYFLAKDTQLLEKISTLSEKGKAEINKIIFLYTTVIENLMLFKGGTTSSIYFAISPLYKPKSNKGKAIW